MTNSLAAARGTVALAVAFALAPFVVACPPPPGLCGDGDVGLGEDCDDGNATDGDGCSAGCTVAVPAAACGDGVVDGNEECDDGKNCSDGAPCDESIDCGDGFCLTQGADGCSEGCLLEPASCGDGVVNEGEDCDDGRQCEDGLACTSDANCRGAGDEQCRPRAFDGCNTACLNEPPRCGDRSVDEGEQCDDGSHCENGRACRGGNDCAGVGAGACLPRGGDGCDATCVVEGAACGDGIVDDGEGCDDGRACTDGTPCTDNVDCDNNGDQLCVPRRADGCDAGCVVEDGFDCAGEPSSCVLPNCGDGAVDVGEGCDDADADDTDGCFADCRVAAGFTCSGAPSVCVAAAGTCGNFVREAGEECDNGTRCADHQLCDVDSDCAGIGDGRCAPRDQTDGCSATCTVERCGNNADDNGEGCDDGKHCSDGLTCTQDLDCFRTADRTCLPRSGDGCSATCQPEACGDGVVAVDEACDNGKQCSDGSPCLADNGCFAPTDGVCAARAGDGCDAACAVVEDGFDCEGAPSQCFGVDCRAFSFVPAAQLMFCPLIGSDLSGANLSGADLSNANLSGVNFNGANLTSTNLQRALFNNFTDLSNADLSGATGQPRSPGSAIYSNTLCPNGANSSTVGNTCVGQGF